MLGMIMPLRNVPNFCTPVRTDWPVLRVGDDVVMGVVLLSWWVAGLLRPAVLRVEGSRVRVVRWRGSVVRVRRWRAPTPR
jgi:hypothetical protein